jgi:hypothetical protein
VAWLAQLLLPGVVGCWVQQKALQQGAVVDTKVVVCRSAPSLCLSLSLYLQGLPQAPQCRVAGTQPLHSPQVPHLWALTGSRWEAVQHMLCYKGQRQGCWRWSKHQQLVTAAAMPQEGVQGVYLGRFVYRG